MGVKLGTGPHFITICLNVLIFCRLPDESGMGKIVLWFMQLFQALIFLSASALVLILLW